MSSLVSDGVGRRDRGESMIDTGCQVTIRRSLVSADSSPLMVGEELCMTIVFTGYSVTCY